MSLLIALPCIALSATLLAKIPQVANFGLSALPLAIVIGMVIGHLNKRSIIDAEIHFMRFCQQKLLRTGIVLFGFSLSMPQILAVGWEALVLDALVIVSIFAVGTFVGVRIFNLHRDVAILTSAGSAICGAAAVLATESVLRARQQHVTIAVATVVLFGTLAMFSYPLIYQFAGMSEQAFGIYIGSTVHEVAQAVAAGEAVGDQALQNAVVVKLIRVMLLAPFILMLGAVLARINGSEGGSGRIVVPWFVFGFVAAAGVNSILQLPAVLLEIFSLTSQFMLAIAMAALGTQTQWGTIRKAGIKPIALALILFVLLIAGGFLLNLWIIPAW